MNKNIFFKEAKEWCKTFKIPYTYGKIEKNFSALGITDRETIIIDEQYKNDPEQTKIIYDHEILHQIFFNHTIYFHICHGHKTFIKYDPLPQTTFSKFYTFLVYYQNKYNDLDMEWINKNFKNAI